MANLEEVRTPERSQTKTPTPPTASPEAQNSPPPLLGFSDVDVYEGPATSNPKAFNLNRLMALLAEVYAENQHIARYFLLRLNTYGEVAKHLNGHLDALSAAHSELAARCSSAQPSEAVRLRSASPIQAWDEIDVEEVRPKDAAPSPSPTPEALVGNFYGHKRGTPQPASLTEVGEHIKTVERAKLLLNQKREQAMQQFQNAHSQGQTLLQTLLFLRKNLQETKSSLNRNLLP